MSPNISIVNEQGFTVITIKPDVAWSVESRYKAVERISGDFWAWVDMRNGRLVENDALSFQLDAYKKHGPTYRKLP